MTGESRDGATEPGVLAYATPDNGVGWLPAPVWVRRAVIAVSVSILTLFVLGLPPLAGALDYTREIPLNEVIGYAWAKGVGGTLQSGWMIRVAMFAPAAVAGLLAFLYLRGVGQRIAIVVNVILPAVWLPYFVPVLVIVGPAILVAAVAGRCDGETWSEGMICYSAIASWSTLWLAVGLVLVVAQRRGSIRPAA